MIETQGPALQAEAAYRLEQARNSYAARRVAYERRAARARATESHPTASGHTSVLRGWRLRGSGAWHAAR